MVNRLRLLLAVTFLILTHWLLLASPLPIAAGLERWTWLAVSGVVGLVIADGLLLQAYVWIGARLGMLMMSLAPVVGALLAWLILAEKLTPGEVIGIGLTVSGVIWVILDRRETGSHTGPSRYFVWGILFGLGAAAGQAIGLILAKKGLGGDFPPLSANLIRMLAAASTIWAVTFWQGQAAPTVQRLLSQRRAVWAIAGGAFFGPFVGVWLSLFAIQQAHVGIASALMALPPIFMLPISHFVFKEQIGWQAITGTFVAMAGVAVLFLV